MDVSVFIAGRIIPVESKDLLSRQVGIRLVKLKGKSVIFPGRSKQSSSTQAQSLHFETDDDDPSSSNASVS